MGQNASKMYRNVYVLNYKQLKKKKEKGRTTWTHQKRIENENAKTHLEHKDYGVNQPLISLMNNKNSTGVLILCHFKLRF